MINLPKHSLLTALCIVLVCISMKILFNFKTYTTFTLPVLDTFKHTKYGGVHHVYYGSLPKLRFNQSEPDLKGAAYLDQDCGISKKLKFNRENKPNLEPFEADVIKMPWFLSVAIKSGQGNLISICSAILIRHTWALSAHHCFENKSFKRFIVFGVNKIMGKSTEYLKNNIATIQQIYFHPGYDNSLNKHDLALIKKNIPKLNPPITPVCLPNANVIPLDRQGCVLGGWGIEKQDNILENTDFHLLKTDTEHPTVCQKRYLFYQYDINFNICDKVNTKLKNKTEEYKPTITRKGFSGSGLTCKENYRWVVYGILNWGEGVWSKGGGYALVSTRVRWICCKIKEKFGPCRFIECKTS